MISHFPNELLSNILSFINKIQDVCSCLFVCSQWNHHIIRLIRLNVHQHKLIRWWNIHNQIIQHQPHFSNKLNLGSQYYNLSQHFYDRGYFLVINKHDNSIVIRCTTMFGHSCDLFTVDISITDFQIDTVHIIDGDDYCIHLNFGITLIIQIREFETPTKILQDFGLNHCCNFLKNHKVNTLRSNYYATSNFIFHLKTCSIYQQILSVLQIQVHDVLRKQNVGSYMISTKSHGFLPKNYFSNNYLYIPDEKCLLHWDESNNHFIHYKLLIQPSIDKTSINFHSTKRYGLLFWYDCVCYLGIIINRDTIDLLPFSKFDLTHCNGQRSRVVYCENNEELFIAQWQNISSSCPRISLLS